MADRACAGRGVLMHANEHERTGERLRRERAAVALCTGSSLEDGACPSLGECREWVLGWSGGAEDPCPVSVVGGWTPSERRRLRAGRPAAVAVGL